MNTQDLQAMLERNDPSNLPYAEDGSMQLTPEEKAYFLRLVTRQAYAEGGTVENNPNGDWIINNAAAVDALLTNDPMGGPRAWSYQDGNPYANLQLANGKLWNPSGAASGIKLYKKGDRKELIRGTKGDAETESVYSDPFEQDTYEISGDLSAMNGTPGSGNHADVQYIKVGNKLVPTSAPGFWNWNANHKADNMSLLTSALIMAPAIGGVIGAGAPGIEAGAASSAAPSAFNAAVDSASVGGLAPYSGSVPASVDLGTAGMTSAQTGAGALGLGSAGPTTATNLAAKTWADDMAAKLGPKIKSFITDPMNLVKYGPAAIAALGAKQSAAAATTGATPNPDQRSLNQWDWDKIKVDAAAAGIPVGQFIATHWDKLYSGQYNTQPVNAAQGGALSRLVQGAGAGRDDKIDAKLSDGEYVMDAETVSMLGDGSNKAGALRLDDMRSNLRAHKGAALSKGKISATAKSPLQYIKESS